MQEVKDPLEKGRRTGAREAKTSLEERGREGKREEGEEGEEEREG
jgi:hypothetical protein